MRPRSIVIFEICYLSALAIGFANAAYIWSHVSAMPEIAQMTARYPWYLPVTMGASIIINLLLWFFTARRASVVAKWIVVAFFALSTVSVAISLFRGIPLEMSRLIGMVAWILNAVAVFQLFAADAQVWFAAKGAPTTTASLNETFS